MGAEPQIKTSFTYETIVERVEELPTLPAIVSEVAELINDPMSTAKDLEKVILKDQAITTKILKLINSSYYAIQGGVKDLSRAIGYLGFDSIYHLVLSTSVVEKLTSTNLTHFSVLEFWKHSIGVGMGAETLAKELKVPKSHEFFTAGLIHDIGKLAYIMIDSKLFAELCQYAVDKGLSIHQAEEVLELPKHAVIGSLLAEKWKFPNNLKSTIKYHHADQREKRFGVEMDHHLMIDVVCYSNYVIHALDFGNSGYVVNLALSKDVMGRIGLTDQNSRQIAAKVFEALGSVEQFLEIISGKK